MSMISTPGRNGPRERTRRRTREIPEIKTGEGNECTRTPRWLHGAGTEAESGAGSELENHTHREIDDAKHRSASAEDHRWAPRGYSFNQRGEPATENCSWPVPLPPKTRRT